MFPKLTHFVISFTLMLKCYFNNNNNRMMMMMMKQKEIRRNRIASAGDRDKMINHSECNKQAQKVYKTRQDLLFDWEECKKRKFDHTSE